MSFEEIHGFDSLDHYHRFVKMIEAKMLDDELEPVRVEQRYSGSEIFEETWYRTGSGEVWQLVSPDYPFKGVFLRVSGPTSRS